MTETTNHPTADGQPPKSKPTTDASNENGAGPLLKKPDVLRDPQGRFERHGKALSKTQKKKTQTKKIIDNFSNFVKEPTEAEINKSQIINPPTNAFKRGRGRPKGSLNKTTMALKEQILAALDMVGGQQYLATLAIENSSAFAGLLGKVLPSTLAVSETSGGKQNKITFERVIVWPNGHREVEGVTPKQLPAPSPLLVENNDQSICVEKPSQNSATDNQ
jgi:hypothetical protein